MHQVKKVILINTQWNEKFSPENFKTEDHNATEIGDYNFHWTAPFGIFALSSQQNALFL